VVLAMIWDARVVFVGIIVFALALQARRLAAPACRRWWRGYTGHRHGLEAACPENERGIVETVVVVVLTIANAGFAVAFLVRGEGDWSMLLPVVMYVVARRPQRLSSPLRRITSLHRHCG
jgi:hypothetical protein